MSGPTITIFDKGDIDAFLAPDERLLWVGQPTYGGKFFQVVGDERFFHLGGFVAGLLMWVSLAFIEPDERSDATWVFVGVTVVLVLCSLYLCSVRQYVLRSLLYFVTGKRAIVCRSGSTWRFSKALYVVSCPHSNAYPYQIMPTHPQPSLQIGTLHSYDQVQPFGFGLAHPGLPVLSGSVSAPVLFEYIPNAQEVMEIILKCAKHDDAV